MNKFPPDLPHHPINFSCKRTFSGHLNKISSLEWLPSGEEFISVAQDGKLIFWDAKEARKTSVVFMKSIWAICCTASSDSKMVCVGGLDNECCVYRRRDSSSSNIIIQSSSSSSSNENNNDEDASSASSITQKSIVHEFAISQRLIGHSALVSGCKFFQGNEKILSASADKSCKLWDISSGGGRLISNWIACHERDISCLALIPGEKDLFLTGSFDGKCKIHDSRISSTTSSSQIACFSTSCQNAPEVNCVAFTNNQGIGNYFASGYSDGIVRLFDRRAGASSHEFAQIDTFYSSSSSSSSSCKIKRQEISSLAFSHSGRLIFVAGEKPEIMVYDSFDCASASGKCIKPLQKLKGHGNRIGCMELSPDGSQLLSGSWDRELRLWGPN